MERNLVWASLALGCIGWFSALLLAGRGAAPNANRNGGFSAWPVGRASLCAALLLPLVVWAATLPSVPPFSAGQGWGRGFLLGGLGALLAALVLFRSLNSRGEGEIPAALPLRAAGAGSLFSAIIIVCIPLQLMRHAVIEALLGEALGWLAVALVLALGLKPMVENSAVESSRPRLISLLLTNGAVFTAALCAAAALGVYRDFVVQAVARGSYPAVAVNLASSFSLALLAGGLASELTPGSVIPQARRASLSSLYSVLLGVVLPLGLAWLLALKVLNDLAIVYVIGSGLLLGLLLWWLVATELSGSAASGAATKATLIPVATLVALCGFMLAYQLMQGFGVGLLLLAAWPVSLLALPGRSGLRDAGSPLVAEEKSGRLEGAQLLTLLLAFLALLLLSRLFSMRFRGELRGSGLSDHYMLFGFLAGAVLPALLVSCSLRSQAAMAQLSYTGAAALALPAALLALWGVKIVPAVFAGMGLAIAGLYASLSGRIQQSTAALLAVAVGVALTQWAGRFAPLAEASRADRLHLLLWALGALVLLVLIVDYGSRLARRSAAGGPPAETGKGGAP